MSDNPRSLLLPARCPLCGAHPKLYRVFGGYQYRCRLRSCIFGAPGSVLNAHCAQNEWNVAVDLWLKAQKRGVK